MVPKLSHARVERPVIVGDIGSHRGHIGRGIAHRQLAVLGQLDYRQSALLDGLLDRPIGRHRAVGLLVAVSVGHFDQFESHCWPVPGLNLPVLWAHPKVGELAPFAGEPAHRG